MGKRANRRKFVERFSFPTLSKDQANEAPKPKGYDPCRHQSFWEWRDQYHRCKRLNFSDAKAAFNKLDQQVQERREQLIKLADLVSELAEHTEASYTCSEAQFLSDSKTAFDLEQAKLENITKNLNNCDESLSTLREYEKLIPVPTLPERVLGKIPSRKFWENLSRKKCCQYCEEIDQNREAQRKYLQEKCSLFSQKTTAELCVTHAKAALDAAVRNLHSKGAEWRRKNTERNDLSTRFNQAAAPATSSAVEDPDWQKNGLWCDAELNELRSKLFAAALNMHEAWLAEVTIKDGGFAPNIIAIRKLLSGQQLTTSEHALALWQSLFMVVPIVSSTFASIASQFKELGADSLGWLIIDEAGQAVPQAAVGALWRAKRAVVVGDPLQIEPVFTVPIKLIEALAESSPLPEVKNVMPHKVSVQNLADAANSCGVWITSQEGRKEWIGSPLRVHRRCGDPMFRIANSIAYENKMVSALQSTMTTVEGNHLDTSAWVHVSGNVEDRHVVHTQIELVTKAVISLYQRDRKLPPLYIISPFKRIKHALVKSLADRKIWENHGSTTPLTSDLNKWCQANIGTVHTFQGKEEHSVWMVLGCDSRATGAVAWAARKPNILNVALTRAKRHFFMIGDRNLWGDKCYFMTAKENLKVISPDDFLKECNPQSSNAFIV